MKIPSIFTVSVLSSVAAAALCGSACDLYSLKWQQEFDADTVDTSVWNYRTDKKALSAQLTENVAQSDGHMIINLKKQQVDSYSYTGGGVISKKNFQYGYFESQIQMNYGTGWHSSFWLMAGDGSTTNDVASHTHSEIDIFERDSKTNSSISHNINLWNADNSRLETYGSGALSTSYRFPEGHVFGALWNETTVTFYIDGVKSASLSLLPSKWTHDYMNIWFTSLAYQDTPDDSKLPSKVQSTYIRYYQRDHYLTAGNLCFSHAQGSTPCPSNQNYEETGPSWLTSSLTGYTTGLGTRYSCKSSDAQATWGLPSTVAAGTYDIWGWVIARSDSDPAVTYKILKNSAVVATTSIDQTDGTSRWVRLASNQAIASGQTWEAVLTASGSGCARADTLKFVRTS